MTAKKDFESTVRDRVGDVIPTELWGIVPYALYNHQQELGLTVEEVWLCAYLIMHKWGKDMPRVSMTKLSSISSVPAPILGEWVEALEKKGYVTRVSTGSASKSPEVFDLSGLLRALKKAVVRAMRKVPLGASSAAILLRKMFSRQSDAN